MQIFISYEFSSAWETSFNIFYSSGLPVVNSLSFRLSKKAFVLLLFLKEIATG